MTTRFDEQKQAMEIVDFAFVFLIPASSTSASWILILHLLRVDELGSFACELELPYSMIRR